MCLSECMILPAVSGTWAALQQPRETDCGRQPPSLRLCRQSAMPPPPQLPVHCAARRSAAWTGPGWVRNGSGLSSAVARLRHSFCPPVWPGPVPRAPGLTRTRGGLGQLITHYPPCTGGGPRAVGSDAWSVPWATRWEAGLPA